MVRRAAAKSLSVRYTIDFSENTLSILPIIAHTVSSETCKCPQQRAHFVRSYSPDRLIGTRRARFSQITRSRSCDSRHRET
jgi:hypothetical protein